jgi:hypothetical protein
MNEKNKFKFSYEDVVDYVLGKLDKSKFKSFEQELKTNEELQELYNYVKSNEGELRKIDEWEASEEYLSTLFKLIENINSTVKKFEVGDIYKLNIKELPLNDFEKRLLENLYFVIVKGSNGSITGKDVRVIPLSRLVHYSQPYDLLLTEKLISSKEFGVVAHIHLATNLMTDWLHPFIGKLSKENLNAIIKADYKDYSSVNYKTIKHGGTDDELIKNYWFDEFEIWNEKVRLALNKLQYIILREVGEYTDITSMEKRDWSNNLNYVKSEVMYPLKEKRIFNFDKSPDFLASKEMDYPKKSKSVNIDKDNFIIVEGSNEVLRKLKEKLPQNVLHQKVTTVPLDVIEKKIIKNLDKVDYIQHLKRILVDLKAKVYKFLDLEREEREILYAAREYQFNRMWAEQPLKIFGGNEFEVYLNDYDNKLFMEIIFLNENKIKELKDFYLLNLQNYFAVMLEEVPVKDNFARIPLNFPTDLLMGFLSGCEVGFIFNYRIVSFKFKLVYH